MQHFSSDEMNVLAFQLGMDWSDVPGGTKKAKAIHLIEACEHRNKIFELVNVMRANRPDIKMKL